MYRVCVVCGVCIVFVWGVSDLGVVCVWSLYVCVVCVSVRVLCVCGVYVCGEVCVLILWCGLYM